MTVVGIVALVAGIILLAIEAHVPTSGLIGSLGLGALIAGAALAVVGAGGGAPLAVAVAGGTAALAGGTVYVFSKRVAGARSMLPRGGASGLLGHRGVVRDWNGTYGRVLVDGALWRACDGMTHDSLRKGDPVIVDHVDGLTLRVRKAEEWEVHR